MPNDFDDYDFIRYCAERYLADLSQENAWREQEEGTVYDSVREQSAWRLTTWLGEYLTKTMGEAIEAARAGKYDY